ncbi:hypothetical protein FD723_16485 [Nostoc sp. C052]|nr:hypothetical protein FD723_16485 [Nostoc sp. C052]
METKESNREIDLCLQYLLILKIRINSLNNAHIEYVADDERGSYCVLDSTMFYPQGGGQPSDIGTIEAK